MHNFTEIKRIVLLLLVLLVFSLVCFVQIERITKQDKTFSISPVNRPRFISILGLAALFSNLKTMHKYE